MESESIVYGCIRDWPSDSPSESRLRREINQQVLADLPTGDAWSLLGREMFACCEQPGDGLYQTQV
ncbi:MAG: hypothetical protein R3260_11920, partial [Pseudomonas sp.]|nr:hypothetical protein [Pseudomonas sp.]